MPTHPTDGFTVGFVFSSDVKHVLLQLKQKPPAHRNLYNGIGGRKQPNESWLTCMSRECFEETGLSIKSTRWQLLRRDWAIDGSTLFVYLARYQGLLNDIRTGDAGLAEWFPCGRLPPNLVPDVRALVSAGRRHFIQYVRA
ncbi:NUDIX domain-containing protein [Candidatus Kaiserbacteria bacterium]|nr:NUDIX domain-containing protein [Candidatus Kaiserbacteria bacterium]